MNIVHLVWMTLPNEHFTGRGNRIIGALASFGLKPANVVALQDDGGGDVVPSATSANLANVLVAFDQDVAGGNIGLRTTLGEAWLVIGSFSIGPRRGLIVRFRQEDFDLLGRKLPLDLIASLYNASGAKDAIWGRDIALCDMIEILDADGNDLSPAGLDHVAAVANVGPTLSCLMNLVGHPHWRGDLCLIARKWVHPTG